MKKLTLFFVALLSLVAATPAANAKRSIMELPPFERAVLIIKKFETLHKPKHWPYVGYGHQVQPGEPYRRGVQLTERQADALLRKDLRKFCALYSQYGKDSILLACLHPKSHPHLCRPGLHPVPMLSRKPPPPHQAGPLPTRVQGGR